MKKLAYVAGLFALTCSPLLAALYEGLEVGMDKDQVLKTLRRSKQLEGPPTDALLSRTGLNGVFKTRQSIGGQTFSLNFDYDPSGGLRAVVLYSRSKYRGSEYETRLKSAYKALLVGLTEQFGEPANMPEWVARESLQEGRIQYMHMWKVSPGVFLMSGLGNMGAMEGYFPLFRFSGPSGMPPKSKRDREELKREWAAIPEFPGLKEAELHISDAVRAMGSKKYKDAFECFQQAAELGCPRGYWGMAFLYDQGKYGVKRDKKKAEENMVNLVKEAQESKKKIIMSAMVSVLVIVAAVPLFVVAGMFEMQVWTRVLLMGIGFVIMVMGIAIACVLDREAGAFECPECKERFVPDMKSYVMGPHTITKRKLTCPKCGCTKYCKHVLTR